MAAREDDNYWKIHRLIIVVAIVCVVLACAFYISDPLASAPQLDARENLELAQAFDNGTLAEEPFYRAVLYPYLLSHIHPEHLRPIMGLLIGIALHLTNALLVYRLAWLLWQSWQAAVLGFLLYLLNPASLFYSFQILDITLGICLFLSGLLLGLGRHQGIYKFLLSGLFLGLAVATRPHFLPVVFITPWALSLMRSTGRKQLPVIYASMVGVLLIQGLINYQHGGEFRILPWQGSFNLWAANKPEANGLYFKQSIDVSKRGNNENPARTESMILYQKFHPDETPPYDIDKMSNFWRAQFLTEAVENPVKLIKLWAFKGYAVVNSFEQYNNLSFPFHKDRLPTLRYNPLNWGIIFLLGAMGSLVLFHSRPKILIAWVILILAYASTLVLYYASARFRLPLVPLLAIVAGGSLTWFRSLSGNRARIGETITILTLGAFLTFSSFAGVRNTDTFVQDRLLMANANAEIGEDAEAARYAREVLETHPERFEAMRIYSVSYFNMRLEENPAATAYGDWKDQKTFVHLKSTSDPGLASVLAFYQWQWGERDAAISIWEKIVEHDPARSSLAKSALLAARSIELKQTTSLTPEIKQIRSLLSEDPHD